MGGGSGGLKPRTEATFGAGFSLAAVVDLKLLFATI